MTLKKSTPTSKKKLNLSWKTEHPGYKNAEASITLLWRMIRKLLKVFNSSSLSTEELTTFASIIQKLMSSYYKIKIIELKIKENGQLKTINKNLLSSAESEVKGISENTLKHIERALNLF